MIEAFKRFWTDERGATAIEYALMGGCIAVVIVGAVSLIGPKVQAQFAAAAAGFH